LKSKFQENEMQKSELKLTTANLKKTPINEKTMSVPL
jgi:hypothetical protein